MPEQADNGVCEQPKTGLSKGNTPCVVRTGTMHGLPIPLRETSRAICVKIIIRSY